MEKQKLPNSTLILVLSILSIVTCCCYGIIGLIFGIVAFILARSATKTYEENPDLYTGYNNIKTAKILSLIGIVLSLLTIIAIIITYSVYGVEGIEQMLEEYQQEMARQQEG